MPKDVVGTGGSSGPLHAGGSRCPAAPAGEQHRMNGLSGSQGLGARTEEETNRRVLAAAAGPLKACGAYRTRT